MVMDRSRIVAFLSATFKRLLIVLSKAKERVRENKRLALAVSFTIVAPKQLLLLFRQTKERIGERKQLALLIVLVCFVSLFAIIFFVQPKSYYLFQRVEDAGGARDAGHAGHTRDAGGAGDADKEWGRRGRKDRLTPFFQKLRNAFSLPTALFSDKRKTGSENLNGAPEELARWIGTEKFGFQFSREPLSSDWKVKRMRGGVIIFKAKNRFDDSEIVFAALPKDRNKKYSDDIRNYIPIRQTVLSRIKREMPIRNLRIVEDKERSLTNAKWIRRKIIGRVGPFNTPFKGAFLFFQTPSHFVGMLGMTREFSFDRLDQLLSTMFSDLSIFSLSAQISSARRTEESRNQERRAVQRNAGGKYGASGAVPGAKRSGASGAQEKRKPWERSKPISTLGDENGKARGTGSIILPTRAGYEVCKTCLGKGRCPNPDCDGGFVICQICEENPPRKCRKCRGTGIVRVENPYTRLETWGHCSRCFGTGKQICENNCRGGKLKCPVCGGTGLCPDCRGYGYTSIRRR